MDRYTVVRELEKRWTCLRHVSDIAVVFTYWPEFIVLMG